MQTEFLYPFRIDIDRRDLAWLWALWIHIATLVILLFLVPGVIAAGCLVIGAVSLRAIWDQQAIVRRSVLLTANQSGQWYLESRCGRRELVYLSSIDIVSGFVIVRLGRYGSSSYLILRQDRVSDEQAHKIRVLSLHWR